jgi:type I restriction enzyme S subunit
MTEGNGETRGLPKGWASTMVQEVIEIIDYRGRTPPFSENGIPHLRSSNVRDGKIIWQDLRYVSEETYQVYMTRGLPEKDDVLFTTEAPLGEVAIAPEQRFSLAQRIMILKPNRKCLLPKFLLYQIQSEVFQRRLKKIGTGTTVAGVSSRNFQPIYLVLAPIKEQQGIVEKIEELFSDLDQGIENLKTAQKQLKVYRQVVLKSAFEGKLTEKWREQAKQENPDLKTGEELLAEIKAERENHYQQKLAEWEEAVKEWEVSGKPGKKPTKPQKPKDLPPLTPAELSELPQLPNNSCWEKFGNTVSDVCLGKMLDKAKNKGTLMPYLRNINVRWGDFDLDELVEMRFEEHEEERYGVKYGDLIICEGGEPGRAAIWKEQLPNMKIQKALHRVRFIENLISTRFVMYFLFYSVSSGHINQFFTGTTIKHLTGQRLADLTVPILSFEEQEQIVQEIESRLSICDQLEATIVENLQKAEALRQSILKQAFEGKLVPQDPNDEPAEKLLERIKQEKLKGKNEEQLNIQGV